jgi:uncharacterized protein
LTAHAERRTLAPCKEAFMANPFVHVELNTSDLSKAKAFYSKLFGWKLKDEPMPGGSYTMIDVGEGTGGGMMTNKNPGAPSHWLAYVGVEDVAASTRKAKELGAKIMLDKTEVGEFGWMSVITDPTGATFALWQPKQVQRPQKK